ncbi:MAG: 4Fe-4S binding protein, partial [Oscillospiraceae bacterium]
AGALSSGKTTETTLCAPGGADVAAEVAAVLGVAAGTVTPMSAVVMCQGTTVNCDTMLNYSGVKSCKVASQLFGGPKDCNYGCIGFGDCVEACEYDAIKICDGVARVNPLACKACKMCIKTCPKSIIELVPLYEAKAVVFCKNKDKGAITRKSCKVGCIGCMKCVKACEFDAISVENNVAHVDSSKCTGCGKCVEGCPTNCLTLVSLGGSKVAVNA